MQSKQVKEYIRPMPALWWLKNSRLLLFMIREASSVFIAGYCVFLLVLLYRAEHADAESFAALCASLKQPISIGLHLLALAFALFHSITFCSLTPRALVVRFGEERLPDAAIAGAHYAAWAAVSILILVLVLVG